MITPAKLTFMDLSFAPSLELVSVVREFVGQFYAQAIKDDDAVSRVSLATHEILENAVKYSLDGLTRVRIEFRPEGGGGVVVLQTWNRPKPADMEVLKVRMAELEKASDPFSFYQQLLERASKTKSGSGLGLGRVWAEAEMSIHYSLTDGQVCVTAEAPIHA